MAARRLFRFVTALALLLAMATPTHAQSSLRVSGGTALPLAPDLFTEASAPGIAVEIGPEFSLTDQFGITATIMHARFPVIGTSAFAADAMTAWGVAGRFLVHLRPAAATVRPYVTFGGGPYRLNRAPERVAIVCLRKNGLSHVTGPCPSPILRTRNEPEVRLGMQAGLGVTVALMPALRALVALTPTGLLSTRGELLYAPIQFGIRYRPAR